MIGKAFVIIVLLCFLPSNYSFAQTWTAEETDVYTVPTNQAGQIDPSTASTLSDLEIYRQSTQYKYTYQQQGKNKQEKQVITTNQNNQ
jgi:hypothetical protein